MPKPAVFAQMIRVGVSTFSVRRARFEATPEPAVAAQQPQPTPS
jgi:hypothetical protein